MKIARRQLPVVLRNDAKLRFRADQSRQLYGGGLEKSLHLGWVGKGQGRGQRRGKGNGKEKVVKTMCIRNGVKGPPACRLGGVEDAPEWQPWGWTSAGKERVGKEATERAQLREGEKCRAFLV